MSDMDEELADKFAYRHEQDVRTLVARGFEQVAAEAAMVECEDSNAVTHSRYTSAWVTAVEQCRDELKPPTPTT